MPGRTVEVGGSEDLRPNSTRANKMQLKRSVPKDRGRIQKHR